MNRKRPWIIVGTAAVAIAGFGTAAAFADDDSPARDPQPAPVVQQVDSPEHVGPVQVADSADSASLSTADSPDLPKAVPAPVPAPAAAPAPAKAEKAPAVNKQAQPKKAPVTGSADSAQSADSADSAD